MRFFPVNWGNAEFGDAVVAPVPIGQPCHSCGNPIAEAGPWGRGCFVPQLDTEVCAMVEKPWHRVCFLKSMGIPDELIPNYDSNRETGKESTT
jgi:hypothetical protein